MGLSQPGRWQHGHTTGSCRCPGRPHPVLPRAPQTEHGRAAASPAFALARVAGTFTACGVRPPSASVTGKRHRTEGREARVAARAEAAARDGCADKDTATDLPPASVAPPRSWPLSGVNFPPLPPTDLQEGARTHRNEPSPPESISGNARRSRPNSQTVTRSAERGLSLGDNSPAQRSCRHILGKSWDDTVQQIPSCSLS